MSQNYEGVVALDRDTLLWAADQADAVARELVRYPEPPMVHGLKVLAARLRDRASIWACSVPGHGTVEHVDGVTHCTARGCGRSSSDPAGGGCNCDGDNADGTACTGYCCGPGNCSCSDPMNAFGAQP